MLLQVCWGFAHRPEELVEGLVSASRSSCCSYVVSRRGECLQQVLKNACVLRSLCVKRSSRPPSHPCVWCSWARARSLFGIIGLMEWRLTSMLGVHVQGGAGRRRRVAA